VQAPPTPYLILLNNITLTPADIQQAAGSSPGMLAVTNSSTVIGAWDTPTVLDWGGLAGILQLGPGVEVSALAGPASVWVLAYLSPPSLA
jgi:hypothetical protein